MDTFGNMILNLWQIVDGKTLSYGYSNNSIPEKLRQFQIEFRYHLVNYINSQNIVSKQFLDLCIENMQNISREDLSFYTPSLPIFK